jgi:two-component system LytT family response regulator
VAEIRAVIVDDEPLARRGVRQLLAAYPEISVVGECRNGREAVRALATLQPDLVFLDIQMPGMDGFGVLRAHGIDRMPAVVFVTAHDEFAVRAFEAQALDYLVKPLGEARFGTTITRVRERMQMAGAAELRTRLAALLATRDDHRIAVTTETGQLLIDADEVEWIGAEDYYAGVHAGGKRHRVRESLAALEARLDGERFVRVHRGAIVRLDHVRELRSTDRGTLVVLRDGTRLPVSRRRQARVRALMRKAGRR